MVSLRQEEGLNLYVVGLGFALPFLYYLGSNHYKVQKDRERRARLYREAKHLQASYREYLCKQEQVDNLEQSTNAGTRGYNDDHKESEVLNSALNSGISAPRSKNFSPKATNKHRTGLTQSQLQQEYNRTKFTQEQDPGQLAYSQSLHKQSNMLESDAFAEVDIDLELSKPAHYLQPNKNIS